MTYAIDIEGLSKAYANGVKAVDNITLKVREGDFFAFLGPNGAGKSTTIGILAHLVIKSSGRIRVLGHDIDSEPDMVKQSIGLVPQEFNLNIFEKTYDVLLQQAGYYGLSVQEAKAPIAKYLRLLELWDKRNSSVNTLSGGMKRRLMIARALVHEPKILILDEPTAGVDIKIRRGIWGFLKELNRQGTTIVLTTHYLEEAEELCQNVAIFHKGCVRIHTSLKELIKQIPSQAFVLDLAQAWQLPDTLPFQASMPDPNTLEVVLQQPQYLNDVFSYLSQHAVHVVSMRVKTNRIETMFLDFIG